MRTGVAVLLGIVALCTIPAAASASVFLTSPFEITAGKRGVVKATIYDFDAPNARHSCRLSAVGPRSQPKVAGVGRRVGRRSVKWRVTVRSLARPGTRYRFVARCGKLGSDDNTTLVSAARARLEFTEQHVVLAPGGRWFAYALRVRNPSRVFEARDVFIRLNLVDGSGRIVESGTEDLPFVGVGQAVWVGGTVTAGGETPVRIVPSLTGAERWPRRFTPLRISDIRMVRQPSGLEGDPDGFSARATISNSNRTSVGPTKVTILYFDAAGRLLDSGFDFTGQLPPGGSEGISDSLHPPDPGRRTARIEISAAGLPK